MSLLERARAGPRTGCATSAVVVSFACGACVAVPADGVVTRLPWPGAEGEGRARWSRCTPMACTTTL